MNLLSLALLLGSAVFSYLLNNLLFKFSKNLGVRGTDHSVIRWGSTSKPTTGGIPFFITFIMAALVFFLIKEGDGGFSGEFLGILLTVTIGFFIGLSDDVYNTRPFLKFLGQFSCGLVLILFDIKINLFGFAPLDWTLTLFWVVGIMNSINLLDNMDGVTGTISLTITVTSLVMINLFPGQTQLNPIYFSLVAVAGSFIGFLIMNWKPSKIYMGDTGSQFLGALLAVIGIKFFWNVGDFTHRAEPALQILVPVMVFIVPLMDTTFVTFSRIARGQSPFVGGRDHLTHHLTHVGIPESMVPVALGLVSLVSGLLSIFLVKFAYSLGAGLYIIYPVYVAIVFGVFTWLYSRGSQIASMKQRYPKTYASLLNMKRSGLEDTAKGNLRKPQEAS